MSDADVRFPANSPAPARPFPPLIPALALFVLVLAAYVPAFRAGFIWDDDDYVTHNPTLPSHSGLIDIWFRPQALPQYYPLVHTTFWLEYRLWGLDATGYHAVNVLLHAAAALLIWRIFVLLELPGAWLAAAIFALHPVQVESVAWVTERKNVLSGACAAASAICYLRARGITGIRSERSGTLLLLSLFFFACALFSKTVVVTLPAALLLMVWWKRGRVRWGDIGSVLPMFAMGIPLGLLTSHLERTHVGAVGPEFDISLAERVLIAGRAVWFYLGKLIWPAQLTFNYSRWTIDASDPAAWSYPLAALLLVLLLWMLRGRLGRGPLTAALYFGGTLFPALGFFDVYPMRYSFAADHFQYLASLGPIALGTAAAATWGGALVWNAPSRRTRLVLSRGLATLTILSFGVLTSVQARAYESPLSLWGDTLRKNPESWLARIGMGVALYEAGRYEQAARHLKLATHGNPDAAIAYQNLAAALLKLGFRGEAETMLRKSIVAAEEAGGPDRRVRAADARESLAELLLERGAAVDAVAELEAALQLRRDSVEAWRLLGEAQLQLGKEDQAADAFSTADRLRASLTTSRKWLRSSGGHF